ncbi:IclR family transcriptional regulator [Ottowia sp. VDI28]|uniref:IclR family transcriptional regulator n=1 Tax=Ottowia sp. VDI28 TaxID=3133968 RepID=UPI003C2F4F8A
MRKKTNAGPSGAQAAPETVLESSRPADEAEDAAEAEEPFLVTALARGLSILQCFTAERRDLGTSEIARLTGLPQPTVWRLCRTLSHLGYLVPGVMPDRLRVGAGVLRLGHAAIMRTGIAPAALPSMRKVADRFGISVSLAERQGNDMVVIQRVEAPSILHLRLHIGSTLELGDSSVGWVWLAAQSADNREAALKQLRKHYGANWPEISGKIDEALKEYAKHRFVFNFAKSHPDVNAIGVPVISPDGRRIMGLTCGGTKSSLSPEKLIDEVAPEMLALAEKIAPLLDLSVDQ